MAHTKSRYMQDLGFPDGRIKLSPQQELFAFGTTVLTRTAAGNINYAQAASQTVQYTANLSSAVLRRTGFGEDLQEQFGTAAGTFGPPGIPASAEYQGRPDTIGAMSAGQPITPRTAVKVKGFQLNSFDVIYNVNTNPLTAHTAQVNLTSYIAGQSTPTIVNQLASAANGLTTAVNANITIVNIAMPTPNFYVIGADQDLWIEVNVQTAASNTYTLWGIDALVTFNFN